MDEDPAIGSEVAGFRLDALLGRGGMGAVYRATELSLSRTVALKLILPELAEEERFRARFQREARLAAQIDDPHALPVYQAGEWNGCLYMAMRYVDGTDMAALVGPGPGLHPRHTAQLLRQVAQALDAAHRHGLVHRDVKPANVLLEARDTGVHAYLTDFGLSKAVTSKSGVTKTGLWVGTVSYAAPEQLQAAKTDARSDVYALGCVIFYALTGRPPFQREREVSTLIAHLSEPPPSLASLRPELPAWAELDAVIAKALAKDPDQRHQSAGELAAAIDAAAEHSPSAGELELPSLGDLGPDVDRAAPTSG
jgi:serine/threonine protein kinase